MEAHEDQAGTSSLSLPCRSLRHVDVTLEGCRNRRLVNLLRQRELDPRGWSSAPLHEDFTLPCPSTAITDWVESDFFSHCSAAYCHLGPPPRSTIALAFSHDGSLLASTQYAHSWLISVDGYMTSCVTRRGRLDATRGSTEQGAHDVSTCMRGL